jgi:hypothetical protein
MIHSVKIFTNFFFESHGRKSKISTLTTLTYLQMQVLFFSGIFGYIYQYLPVFYGLISRLLFLVQETNANISF